MSWISDSVNALGVANTFSKPLPKGIAEGATGSGLRIDGNTSSGSNAEDIEISASSRREKMRHKMENIWYWSVVKRISNSLLNLSKMGEAIKAYYIKP